MTESLAPDPGTPAPRGRSSRRSLLLTSVALLVLGGAGWSIYATSGDEIGAAVVHQYREWTKPAPPTPEEVQAAEEQRAAEAALGGPMIGEDEPAYWTEVALFRANPDRPRAVVVFRRAKWSHDVFEDNSSDHGELKGLIMRELVRQALILTTREATDAVVRDCVVGDPDEAGTPDATVRLGSMTQSRHPGRVAPLGMRIDVVAGSGADRRVLFHRTLDVIQQEVPPYGLIVGRIEGFMRADLRGVLAGWKLPPGTAPKVATDPEALPEGVEARLLSLAEAEQLAALRALHDDVRRRGGSPARWHALARGYAMLGSLTEPLASASHAVFKARALLYSQVAVAVEHNSPRSLRSQAFAELMAGLNREARHDLELADKADGRKGLTPRDEAVAAYIDMNLVTLAEVAKRMGADPLAVYLRALAGSRVLERTGEVNEVCRNELIALQEPVLKLVPDCNRAIDNMIEASGVSNLHRTTMLGMESFAPASRRRVAAQPGLPPALVELIRAQDAAATPDAPDDSADIPEVALRRALDGAARTDSNDLSWGALAQILRETRFWQVGRRLHFLAVPLGSSPREFAIEARPLVADHPNREFLDLWTGELDPAHAVRLVRRLDLDGMERKNAYVLLLPVRGIDPDLNTALWNRARRQADIGTVINLEWDLRSLVGPNRAAWAAQVFQVDRASPPCRAALVATNWAAVRSQAFDWEREQPWNTPLKAEPGLQLVREKRYAEARERLETALGRSPEGWIFAGLAKAYREQNETESYIRAARAMLDQPDQGLDHAEICNALANHLMKLGRVDVAWPWAERGAESWANWAMETAWRCAEMRRDWPNAEAWIARQSQRYGDKWLNWLGWSLRTGHGHVAPAAALVWARVDAGELGSTNEEESLVADFGLILDRADVARAIAEKHLGDAPGSTADSILLAAACEKLKDRKARDAALDQIVGNPQPSGPKTAKIVALLVDWDRHRDARRLPDVLILVDEVLASIPAPNRPNSEAAIGQLLTIFGQPAEAVPYLKRGDVTNATYGLRLLVRHLLADRGETPVDFYLDPPRPRPGTAADEPAEL